jgi:YrbI family 3-deoxy-D-manno-octulosonate 8-phosphate phosphatase
MRCWAVIPARGGSKGVLRKNLQKVGGLSLVARSVAAAVKARMVERVFVSTDDAEIALAAREAGAEVILRPPALASDTASSEDALLHALDGWESAGELPDILAFIQCTSPFVRGEDIDGAVRALMETRADCAITLSASHGFLWRKSQDGFLQGVNHDGVVRQRRQDREPEFLENGAVYVLRVPAFRRVKQRFCGPVAFYEMPAERSMEIDDQHELEVARRLAPLFQDETDLPERVSAVIFDFDGVMTDNKVIVETDGGEAVVCDRSDGMGIDRLKRLGLPILILSKERNQVVTARAGKLGVECLQGIDDKLSALENWARHKDVDLKNTIYVGNDINDITCLERVGYPVVVADAHPAVVPYARIRLSHRGGYGAVREICDRIVAATVW